MRRKKQRPETNSTAEGQISLFGARETPDAFRKAVQVVHSKPRSPLSLLQRKLGNAWLKNALESQPDAAGWWELGIKKLATSVGFDSNNRQYLKDSAEALMRIVFEWDVIAPAEKRVLWKASVLFPEVEMRSDVVRYQISSQMRERMVNPDMYAMIDMNIVRRFRRASSLAIWEFCVRFEKIGRTAEVQWEKFRDMALGESAEAKTYQEYKYFKSKVLNPAIAEINSESNHSIDLIEEKIGRRVSSIRFEIRRKATVEAVPDDDQFVELLGELVKLGVPQSEAKRLSKSHTLEEIKGALGYTKRRLSDRKLAKLENPAAYFRHALANRYAVAEEKAVSKPTEAPRSGKTANIKEAYALKQVAEAERYFNELDPNDQAAMMERYNQQQPAAALRLKKKVTKLGQVGFFQWLAMETWGEPTAEELLDFAQGMLTGRSGG